MSGVRERFEAWFAELAAIGRLEQGGWRRLAWTEEDRAARDWFRRVASSLGLEVERDRNGGLWAWWGEPGAGAVVTGSHLDTVARGGAYDGALGVVGGLVAVEQLQQRHGPDRPPRPLAVVAFADEEGGRFNLPCFTSRLMVGALDPAAVVDRTDSQGVTLREAVRAAGFDPDGFGPDPDRLALVDAFVELHVEQGRALVDEDLPLAVGTAIWPHGRWRLTAAGDANHAGTTRLRDRHDPMMVLAAAVDAARTGAAQQAMVATVGRVEVEPNSPTSVAERVTLWLDARAPNEATLDRFLAGWEQAVAARAADHSVTCEVSCDARTSGVELDLGLRDHIATRLRQANIPAMPLATAAGHDAGVLASHVPAAMLFVRNPTGASHTPGETASVDDCLTGIAALLSVIEDLVW